MLVLKLIVALLLLLPFVDAGPKRNKAPSSAAGRPRKPGDPPIEISDSDDEAPPSAPSSGDVYTPGRIVAPGPSQRQTRSNGLGSSSARSASTSSHQPTNKTATLSLPAANPPPVGDPAPGLARAATPESLGRLHLALNEDPRDTDLYTRATVSLPTENYEVSDRAVGRTLHPQFIFNEAARIARFHDTIDVVNGLLHLLERETNADFIFMVDHPDVNGPPGTEPARCLPSRSILSHDDLTSVTTRFLREFRTVISNTRRAQHALLLQQGRAELVAMQEKRTQAASSTSSNAGAGSSSSLAQTASNKRKRAPSDAGPRIKRERHSPILPSVQGIQHISSVDDDGDGESDGEDGDDEAQGATALSSKAKGKQRAQPEPEQDTADAGGHAPASQPAVPAVAEPVRVVRNVPVAGSSRAGSLHPRVPTAENSRAHRSSSRAASISGSDRGDHEDDLAGDLARATRLSLRTARREQERRRQEERQMSSSGTSRTLDDATPRANRVRREVVLQLPGEVTKLLEELGLARKHWIGIEQLWRSHHSREYYDGLTHFFLDYDESLDDEDVQYLSLLLTRYPPPSM